MHVHVFIPLNPSRLTSVDISSVFLCILMAPPENGEKPMAEAPRPRNWVILVLRLLAFAATAAATIVMALNKQTKTFVVGTQGTTPIKATLTAKFNQTPAFVFFVIANALVGFHNLLMLMVNFLEKKVQTKAFSPHMIAIFDMLNVVLVSGGANAAAFMAELGKNGNSHAKWNKICDKFERYCDHGGGALIASFVGLALMLLISVMSIIKLVRLSPTTHAKLELVP